jgi:hypothetical protein
MSYSLPYVSAEVLSSTSLIWVCSGSRLATYDVLSKEFTIIGSTTYVMFDIAMSPNGILYAVDGNNNLYTLNRKTGAPTLIGAVNPTVGTNALTFGQYGALYGMQNTNLVSINPVNAEATVIGNTGFQTAGDLVFFNNNLYLASTTNQLVLVDIGNPSNSQAVGDIPATYGLATVYVTEGNGNGAYHMYGTGAANLNVYEINVSNGFTSNTTTMPSFGSGGASGTDGATSSQFTWI